MRILVKATMAYLSITINEIPHLFFSLKEFQGFQSWLEGNEKYVIMYYFTNRTKIKTEYNSKEKFEFILNELKTYYEELA